MIPRAASYTAPVLTERTMLFPLCVNCGERLVAFPPIRADAAILIPFPLSCGGMRGLWGTSSDRGDIGNQLVMSGVPCRHLCGRECTGHLARTEIGFQQAKTNGGSCAGQRAAKTSVRDPESADPWLDNKQHQA